MEHYIPDALQKCPLFQGCTPEEAASLAKACRAVPVSFEAGETIPLKGSEGGRIGIVVKGKATVYSARDGRTILNRLEAGSLFGVSSLYSDHSAETLVVADSKAEVLIWKEAHLDPLWQNKKARENLISFLTGRIRFLTERIASFTAPSAEKKLIRYLLQKAGEGTSLSVRSYSDLAKELSLGRASLYRALEKLEEEGLICRSGKEVTLPSPEKAELYLAR
ncbi:MAG: Crp/Fnr family transcriptional regulator [Clostridia bacterium]|nr:Crp/Fnr family transcriptional regulator [Clostridia bacterium]